MLRCAGDVAAVIVGVVVGVVVASLGGLLLTETHPTHEHKTKIGPKHNPILEPQTRNYLKHWN